ncbi:hypothetical protein [Streptomyces sp. HC307]|uniref:hypothetical protein n=1 Tax=Streptomyces flavusporus TaxID=3385496 RepID=UPI003916F24C
MSAPYRPDELPMVHAMLAAYQQTLARDGLTFTDGEDPTVLWVRRKEEAAGCLMTESSPPTTDPVYEPLLEPLFSVAEEAPYVISRVIKGR